MYKFIRILLIGGMLISINMSVLAKESIVKTIGHEGKYSNHKSDTGGKTMYGITVKVARRYGYKGRMRDLPYDIALAIYHKNYWRKNRLDEFKDEELAYMVYDASVNCGVGSAIILLQKSYNLLVEGSPLKVDGLIGKNTINKINSYKDPRRLRMIFEGYKIKRYIEITEKRPRNEDFIYGWLRRRSFLGGMR